MLKKSNCIFTVVVLMFHFSHGVARSQSLTNMGTDFWLQSILTSNNIIFADSPTPNHVTLELYGGRRKPDTIVEYDLGPNSLKLLWQRNADSTRMSTFEKPEFRCIHVHSRSPIFVNCMQDWTSAEGFLAIPTQSLGQEYIAACYSDDSLYSTTSSFPGEFLIISPYDSTLVSITASANTTATASGDTLAHHAHEKWSVVLDRGQCYRVASTGLEYCKADLTGTRIESDKPIAVISGHVSTAIPGCIDANGTFIVNSLEEMLPAVDRWGSTYFAVPKQGASTSGSMIRLIAGEDSVSVYANKRLFGTLLHKGDHLDYEQLTNAMKFSGSGKKMLAVEYMYSYLYLGDTTDRVPLMTVLPSVEHYQSNFVYNTIDPWNSTPTTTFMTTLRVSGSKGAIDSLMLNGLPLSNFSGAHQQYSLDSSFSYAYIPLRETQQCTVSSSSPVGAIVYSEDEVICYGFPVSLDLANGKIGLNPVIVRQKDKDRFSESFMLSTNPKQSGLAAVDLVQDAGDARVNDRSYNVELLQDSSFITGNFEYRGSIRVLDSSKDAHGVLWYVDQSGKSGLASFSFKGAQSTVVERLQKGLDIFMDGAERMLILSLPTGTFNVLVYNAGGSEVMRIPNYSGTSAPINISRLDRGLYFVRAQQGLTCLTGRFCIFK